MEQSYKASPAVVEGSTAAGFCAGFFGGCIGLPLVLAFAKGEDTKRGAWIGFGAAVLLAIIRVLAFAPR